MKSEAIPSNRSDYVGIEAVATPDNPVDGGRARATSMHLDLVPAKATPVDDSAPTHVAVTAVIPNET